MNSGEDFAREAIAAFGFSPGLEVTSLCAYSPVYRIRSETVDVVLKRTGYPRSRADAIATWLRGLRDRGVNMVAPVSGFEPNPRRIRASDEWSWVIYPFVSGRPYRRSPADLRAAGRLLGRMHAAGADLGKDMLSLLRMPSLDHSKVAAHVSACTERLDACGSGLGAIFEEWAMRRLADYDAIVCNHDLPAAACSWDFKASNLVFDDDRGATLVDPDHAGRLPRIFDAAVAALLFHCDLEPSPGALWSASEWSEFFDPYGSQLAWTPKERAVWGQALAAAWLDEALWLLAHFPQGWNRKGERDYLIDLAFADLDRFRLP
jgi:spectinomycin phosphotransferase